MERVNTGGRPLTRAALAGRRRALDEGRAVSRRELAGHARDAAKSLALRPSLRQVLEALVAAWGEQPWARLLVWPSNERLCEKTGLSERAVRYALRDLVALELIAPKDSANGKRYAIRAPDGSIVDAFGFDLLPVVARAGEWAERLRALTAEVEHRRRSFDLLTVCRRAVSEALHGLATQYPGVSITDLAAARDALEESSPMRSRSSKDPSLVVEAWSELRELAEDRFYQAACAGKSCSHIETDNEPLSKSCNKVSSRSDGARAVLHPALVAAACPVAAELGFEILTEPELIDAGRSLRGSIGAHPSAWTEACESLGLVQAAALVVMVAQLHDDETTGRRKSEIRNPGGYFRHLVRLCLDGRYSVAAELMTMRRRRMT
ncbi:plasmid replication protein RepC [Methylobacterium oryzihabitans]|uniref:Replication protein C n=1 Tax=Methylobacterium oryzihabitans TaxID=2499852 RepID=A0A437P812_9HYPH|nr:plasmid replication protein RepC [Methylobacterium oryzihabitans]RVU18412.1 replication protein C [Methylobacterium oryzihabitans]